MISIANNEKEKNSIEMSSFNGAVHSNLLICNDLEESQMTNFKTLPVRRSSFNLETNIVVNDNLSLAYRKSTMYRVVCFLDLRTNH